MTQLPEGTKFSPARRIVVLAPNMLAFEDTCLQYNANENSPNFIVVYDDLTFAEKSSDIATADAWTVLDVPYSERTDLLRVAYMLRDQFGSAETFADALNRTNVGGYAINPKAFMP